MTTDECKRTLFKLGIKYGISPRLISERLLSLDDKKDMLEGLVSFEALDKTVEVWKAQGMPNYAEGSRARYNKSAAIIPCVK